MRANTSSAVKLILTILSTKNFQMDHRSSNGVPCHRSSSTSFFPPPGSLHESVDYVPSESVLPDHSYAKSAHMNPGPIEKGEIGVIINCINITLRSR